MKKIIKMWGKSFVIRLSPDEVKIIGLKEGDIVNVDITDIETKDKYQTPQLKNIKKAVSNLRNLK